MAMTFDIRRFLFSAVTASVLSCSAIAGANQSGSMDSCISVAADRYHVDENQIRAVIATHERSPQGIGVMGIPPSWLAVLNEAGVTRESLDDTCDNIAAGAWIIAYSREAQQVSAAQTQPLGLTEAGSRWQFAVTRYAKESGLPVALINAVIQQESGFNPDAVSGAGAIGLMQLMPKTAAWIGVNPYNPIDNLRGGIAYLRDLYRRFDGDLALTLAAYNAGEGAVNKYGGVPPYAETQGYVSSVIHRYNRYAVVSDAK